MLKVDDPRVASRPRYLRERGPGNGISPEHTVDER